MGLVIKNTNYSGEVLEQILTVAATGNDLVRRGLIHVIPGVSKKISIPRMHTGKMLQKQKEMPVDSDSKGEFKYSEKALNPVDFMAFTTFNPRAFEKIWRKWQPKGNLVFAELPIEVQNLLLSELTKTVQFELGYHYINGVYGDTDDELFNGIIFRMEEDEDTVRAGSSSMTMIGQLAVLRRHIPVTMRENPGLRIIMSINEFDRYDAELTAQQFKGVNWTDVNQQRFKGIRIEALPNWPEGKITATITGMDYDTNLWAAVNLKDDEDVIQIDKLTNAGERYFFKILMKADTNIAFGEECIMLERVAASITADRTAIEFDVLGGDEKVLITATEEFEVNEIPDGFFVLVTDEGLLISADDNSEGADIKTASLVVSLKEHKSRKVTIELTQPNA